MMTKKIPLFLFSFLYSLFAIGQQVPLGQWRTHLPYNSVLSIDAGGNEIFCGTIGGVFIKDRYTGEVRKLSTINGLAEINVSKLAYNTSTSQLMIAYDNSNIDLLVSDKIYHLPEIFKKTGLGNKRINSITFNDELAYLSCGFGIVVFDLVKREVKDTYFIGDGGANLEVFDIAINQQNIFASTANGIYQASLSNPLLADYKSWSKHGISQSLPAGISPSIVSFNGFIYGNFSNNIYKFKDGSWQLTSIFGQDVKSLRVSKNKLLTIAPFRIISYDLNENIIKNIQSVAKFSAANDAIIDENQNILIADRQKGLVETINGSAFNYILPNCPNTIAVQELRFVDGKLLLSPGASSEVNSPTFNNDGFSFFENETWTSYNNTNLAAFTPIRDIVTSTLDASTQKKYLGSYVNGLIEFNPDLSIKIYNQNNSTLQTTIGDPASIRVNGVILDNDNNLWVSQFGVAKPLSKKSPSGEWTSYGFPDIIPNPAAAITGLTIDFNNNKWLKLKNSGLVVFNGSLAKKLGFSNINGLIPGTNVNSLTVDKEGAMWLGTNKGVAVFYDTENIFANVNAEIPNVVEGGFLKPLLNTENINCIAVDGANRKWVGTDNGVWLFTADGTKQIQFFNKNNSPLLSNKVLTISIDPNNGEVFFGTAAGIISYKGDATEPVNKMNKITVYPNPVRPGFSETIGIKGLSDRANVKITDINGVLVYQTISNGGEATWNGKNFNGDEASSGVYLVLIVNSDGSDTAVSKILIVR
jgi:hypothetical protein